MTEERDLPELPLERYEFTTSDSRRHTEAQARMAQSCMRKLGFDDFPLYPKQPDPDNMPTQTLTVVAMSAYPYGPLDLDRARRWGYGWDPKKSLARTGRPEGRAMTDAERDALYGGGRGSSERGGCGVSDTERLTDGVQDKTRMWTYTAKRRQHLDKAAAKDKRVREAVDTWAGCMEDKGIKRYKSPSAAFQDKAWGRAHLKGGQTTRTKRELATATADVECKREHNTAGVWWAVRDEKQRVDVARHRDVYEAVREDQDRVRANVRRVLDER
ncbi:hypothetical protein ACGFSB_29770 [Streptomyces sp. NPDC048441]|uniref:hypothetical protein n=1 Tax=Streptomyces sp. NPDC048441 TaxID=3365552 RepID=UPI00371CF87F